MIDTIVAKQFKILRKLGAGSFGEVYKAVSIQNGKQFAVKFENVTQKKPQLFYEAKLINQLTKDQDKDQGIPHVYYSTSQDQYNIMVMQLMGPSLEKLFSMCNKKFDLKTITMIAIQMLQRIQLLHSKGIIHRDIKPDNFVIGNNSKGYKIYLIDFGLAKKYLDRDGKHIPYKDNKNLTGTARYASLNTHLGIEQGRRDDLECIGNCLLYFFKGQLPWQSLRANNKKQKYEKIMDKKLSIPLSKLCLDIPNQFQQLLRYSRCLQFEETPDYDYLIGMFKKLMERQKFKMDFDYCWEYLKKQQYSFSESDQQQYL